MSNLQEAAHKQDLKDIDSKHDFAVEQGLKAAAVFSAAGLGAGYLLNRHSATFRSIKTPYKVFLALFMPTAAFFTVSDRSAVYADRAHGLKYSITTKDELQPVSRIPKTITEWLVDNKYGILFGTWSAGMAGALYYNFSIKHLTTQQKVVNSRMVAQSMALVGLGCLAWLSTLAEKTEKKDPHFERIIHSDNK